MTAPGSFGHDLGEPQPVQSGDGVLFTVSCSCRRFTTRPENRTVALVLAREHQRDALAAWSRRHVCPRCGSGGWTHYATTISPRNMARCTHCGNVYEHPVGP